MNEGLCDPDDVPLPPDAAITQPGDLWILGNHRLLCADSSKPEPDATCKVARTVTIGKVVASEVTCDRELPVAGVYLAMPQGLYRSGFDFPATAADIKAFRGLFRVTEVLLGRP